MVPLRGVPAHLDGNEDHVSLPLNDREAPPTAPTACPFCRATTIRSPGEKVDLDAYWRCEACGEMWNLSRMQSLHRYNNAGSYWK